jgi:hypothetical protein
MDNCIMRGLRLMWKTKRDIKLATCNIEIGNIARVMEAASQYS